MSHRHRLILLPPNRVWRTYPGGRTLDALAGAPAPADTHFAEDWIASTTVAKNPPGTPPYSPPPDAAPAARPSTFNDQLSTAPGISRVLLGHDPTPHDFAALLASDPDYFLGPAHVAKYGAQPQLLVKFLDSGTRLHFQVHPTRDFARRLLGAPSGKTEAYYVLAVRDAPPAPPSSVLQPSPFNFQPAARPASEPTGCIYVGFQRPPTPAQLRDWIVTQDLAAIEACFDRIPVRPGDTFIIPGGTPHALGAGVFMVEIQEPSDLVVRFEFERAGYVLPEASRFMGRDVDFGLTVFNFSPLDAAALDTRVRCRPRRLRDFGPGSYQEELIGAAQTDCFRVLRTTLAGPVVKDESSAAIAIVTRGTVIASVGDTTHRLRPFDKIFVPAALGPVAYTPESGDAELLECLPPAP
jgi:mannose-6-phosphate isomerase